MSPAQADGVEEAKGVAEEEEKEVKTQELNCIVVGCIPVSAEDPTIRAVVVAVKMNGNWRSSRYGL